VAALMREERCQSLAGRISSCVFGIGASLRVPGASRQANAGEIASRVLSTGHWIPVYTGMTSALFTRRLRL